MTTLLALLFAGCTSSPTTTFGTDAIAQIESMRAAVNDHVSAMQGVSTMADATALEDAHATAMAEMMGTLDGMMGDMMGCGMDGMMGDMMSDADSHMQGMMDDVEAHHADHDGHADLQACWDEETTYSTTMAEHMDAMHEDMGTFDDSATCSGSSSGMM